MAADAAGVDVDEEFVDEFVDVGVVRPGLAGGVLGSVRASCGLGWVEVVEVVVDTAHAALPRLESAPSMTGG